MAKKRIVKIEKFVKRIRKDGSDGDREPSCSSNEDSDVIVDRPAGCYVTYNNKIYVASSNNSPYQPFMIAGQTEFPAVFSGHSCVIIQENGADKWIFVNQTNSDDVSPACKLIIRGINMDGDEKKVNVEVEEKRRAIRRSARNGEIPLMHIDGSVGVQINQTVKICIVFQEVDAMKDGMALYVNLVAQQPMMIDPSPIYPENFQFVFGANFKLQKWVHKMIRINPYIKSVVSLIKPNKSKKNTDSDMEDEMDNGPEDTWSLIFFHRAYSYYSKRIDLSLLPMIFWAKIFFEKEFAITRNLLESFPNATSFSLYDRELNDDHIPVGWLATDWYFSMNIPLLWDTDDDDDVANDIIENDGLENGEDHGDHTDNFFGPYPMDATAIEQLMINDYIMREEAEDDQYGERRQSTIDSRQHRHQSPDPVHQPDDSDAVLLAFHQGYPIEVYQYPAGDMHYPAPQVFLQIDAPIPNYEPMVVQNAPVSVNHPIEEIQSAQDIQHPTPSKPQELLPFCNVLNHPTAVRLDDMGEIEVYDEQYNIRDKRLAEIEAGLPVTFLMSHNGGSMTNLQKKRAFGSIDHKFD